MNQNDSTSPLPPESELSDFYNKALFYAAAAHDGQLYAGLPYVIHVCMVAAEVMEADKNEPLSNIKDAVQIALLHDVLEDTPITEDEMLQNFKPAIVHGVNLLTKRKGQPLEDYLLGIKNGGSDVSVIKMCDRIVNLQKPPAHWGSEKILEYYEESILILEMLGWSSEYVSRRLKGKIELYEEMFMGK